MERSELLRVLKNELSFWEEKGYGDRFRSEWRPTLLLRDSPVCLNAIGGPARPCRECVLFELIPPKKKNSLIPCHHIPLNQAGDTIASLYGAGTQEKLDQMYLGWLRATIEEFEKHQKEATIMNTLECATAISFKNILYLTDFSPASEGAFSYAVALARHFGARLYPAHIVAPYMPTEMAAPVSPDVFQKVEEQSRDKLAGLFQGAGVPCTVLVTQGLVESVVPEWMNEHGIDLIVMGTHGRKGLGRLFLGSTAEIIFRTASCPVLTVGPHVRPQPLNELDIKKVLFATSLAAKNGPSASYALSLAREEGADLSVLHVLETPAETPENWNVLAEDARNQMKELAPLDGGRGKTDFFVEPGDAATRILEYANKLRPGLIVMGASGNTSSTHFRRGVAFKVMSAAPCAVLTAR